MNPLPKAIFLMGPTASGKTSVAIALRNYLPVELISVDSALIYKNMNIGTSKPSKEELLINPHRLLDILDPSEIYSAAQFRNDVLINMKEITQSGRIPLLVGGTMFYYHVLINGLSPLPDKNESIRKYIKNIAIEKGYYNVFKWLKKIDPHSSQDIHPNDFQRIMRALEVFLISGKRFSSLKKHKEINLPYNIIQFALFPLNRIILHQRIENRFKNMIKAGFETEVRHLFSRNDLNLNLPSIRCVGYRQMWEYFLGKIDYNEMIFRSICATRQLAKNQMSWLRNWKNIFYIRIDTISSICKNILVHLKNKNF